MTRPCNMAAWPCTQGRSHAGAQAVKHDRLLAVPGRMVVRLGMAMPAQLLALRICFSVF